MGQDIKILQKLTPALMLLCLLPASAATVYKTVDENGVVSFSDEKPVTDAPVEQVTIDARSPDATGEAQQRLNDMRETTDRMAADRMAREKHRAELRQMQADTAATEAQQGYGDYADYPDYLVGGTTWATSSRGWGYGYPRRHWRHHRPRPSHPIARPPLRPPHHGRPPGVRPLPGNDYPASLIRRNYPPKVRAAFRN